MIKSLLIKNIQSHKESELIFSPGINVIIGSSNNGKSSIIRAINWVVRNRPMGVDVLCSHWAIDDKGNQKDEMAVTISTEKSTITRYRTKSKNQYQVDRTILNAVKSDVPQLVSDALLMAEANMQTQQDSPFLLSLPNEEVGRYFNRIVNLDIIDLILSNAEGRRRKTNYSITSIESEILSLDKDIENYSWLDSAEKLFAKYKNISEKVSGVRDKKEKLRNYCEKYQQLVSEIEAFNVFDRLKEIISKYMEQTVILDQLEGRIRHIDYQLAEYAECMKYTSINFSTTKKLIDKIIYCGSQIDTIDNRLCAICSFIEKYDKLNATIKRHIEDIAENKKSLPNVCPLCGAIMGAS